MEVVFLSLQYSWCSRQRGHQLKVSTGKEVWGFEKIRASIEMVMLESQSVNELGTDTVIAGQH